MQIPCMLDKNNPHVGYKHTVCWIQIPICWMQTARMMWIQECCKSRKDNLVVMVIISLQTALFLIFIIQATLLEQLSSPLVFSGVLVTRSLVLCVMLCSCLTFCPFSFGHCVVCPFSFGHCVVCPFVLFLLVIVLSVLYEF